MEEATEPRSQRPSGGIQRVISAILEWASVLLIGSLSVLVFANAFSRYMFANPLPWTEEVVVHLLTWVAAVGIVLAGMRQSLICCNILVDRLSTAQARVLAVVCAALGAVVMLIISWLTWRYLTIFGSDLSPVLRIPKAVIIGGLLFASLGLSAALLTSVLRR